MAFEMEAMESHVQLDPFRISFVLCSCPSHQLHRPFRIRTGVESSCLSTGITRVHFRIQAFLTSCVQPSLLSSFMLLCTHRLHGSILHMGEQAVYVFLRFPLSPKGWRNKNFGVLFFFFLPFIWALLTGTWSVAAKHTATWCLIKLSGF